MLMKRDRDLDILRKKNEKARENMREIHESQEEKLVSTQLKEKVTLEKTHSKNLKKASKTSSADEIQAQNEAEWAQLTFEQEEKLKALRKSQAEVFVAMCTDQYKAEMELCLKHLGPCYEALRAIMDQNHRDHECRLRAIHDQEVKDLTKRMDAQTKEEMRILQKKHKDKQALNRLKRENQKKHIDTVVSERQKLEEILDSKIEDLQKRLNVIREELEKDKTMMERQYTDMFTERLRKLQEDKQHLLQLSIALTSTQTTATNGNSAEPPYKTQM